MKYRRMVDQVDAVKWDGLAETANSFVGESYEVDWEYVGQGSPNLILIHGYNRQLVKVGQYIIKTGSGMTHPVPADIFELIFELVC